MDVLLENPTTLVIMAALVIGLGAITCFFGYRFLRLFLVVLGFIVGFFIGTSLVPDGGQGTLLAGVILGVIAAIIFYFLYMIAFVLAGASLGLTVATVVAENLELDPTVVPLVLVAGAIIGGIIAIFVTRYIIMLGTAFSGAGLIITGVLLLIPGAVEPVGAGEYAVQLSSGGQLLATVVWAILGFFGLVTQLRNNRRD